MLPAAAVQDDAVLLATSQHDCDVTVRRRLGRVQLDVAVRVAECETGQVLAVLPCGEGEGAKGMSGY